jgi:hypothetical protein
MPGGPRPPAGLVHVMGGAPSLQDSLYSVDLIPVGLQSSNTLPDTEDDARRLVHGLLHGLAAIHEVEGWTNRLAAGCASCERLHSWVHSSQAVVRVVAAHVRVSRGDGLKCFACFCGKTQVASYLMLTC